MHLESPRSGKYPLAALGVTGGIANFHNRDLDGHKYTNIPRATIHPSI